VARFNDMFLEREEDAVIRLRSLEDEGSAAHSAAALKDVYRCALACGLCPTLPPTPNGQLTTGRYCRHCCGAREGGLRAPPPIRLLVGRLSRIRSERLGDDRGRIRSVL